LRSSIETSPFSIQEGEEKKRERERERKKARRTVGKRFQVHYSKEQMSGQKKKITRDKSHKFIKKFVCH